MLFKYGGEEEEAEEKADSYIAMHVYPNQAGGGKILEDKGAIVRNVYTNESNYMLYLQLNAVEYYRASKVLNMVLD